MADELSAGDPWRGWNADVAHRSAPAGGGGPGEFRDAPFLGRDLDLFLPPPHPQAPATRYLVLDGSTGQPAPDQPKSAPHQPPPPTEPVKTVIRKEMGGGVDVELVVEVLADGRSPDDALSGARTSFDSSGIAWSTPGYKSSVQGGTQIVTGLTGGFSLKGTIKIQTVYGPTASEDQRSAYGRGTTADDETAGNTSLGFHESCHRADYLAYLKNNPLPRFTGRIGMSVTAYQHTADLFKQSLQRYFDEMKKDSIRRTDEVGYPLSDYRRYGPRP